jgi:hypothetical protein
MRLTAVDLGPSAAYTVVVTRPREHLVAGRDKRRHPRAPIGLDPDNHLPLGQRPGLGADRVLVKVLGQQLVQPGHTRHALRQSGLGQPVAGVVEDLHVMVILGPVVSHEQHHRQALPIPSSTKIGSVEQDSRGLMVKCSPRVLPGARHPISDLRLLTTGGRTI